MGRNIGSSAWSCRHLKFELVQALAVVGERHKVPFARHLVEAAQGEVGEAEDRFDDAEDRLDRLLTQLVEGATLLAGELCRHGLEPFGLGFLGRRLGFERPEVVAPASAFGAGRHQNFNIDPGQARNLITIGIAVVRRFTRLTNAFSKKVENLAHAVALHFMYYNFVRIHQSLRVTPAMAAGVTDTLWEIEDIAKLSN